MSSFIDGLIRKAQGKDPVATGVDFDCLILEQPPQDWSLIRQRICEGTLQSSFDKGDLALIAENAILWYDRLRRNARNEWCLAATPNASPEKPQPTQCSPDRPASTLPAPVLPDAAENTTVLWTPDPNAGTPVPPNSALSRAAEEARLDREAYVDTLHDVLSERTKRVIRTEQLLRERNRHILDLQRQLTEQAGASDSLVQAMRLSLEASRSANSDRAEELQELREEVADEIEQLSVLADKHRKLWERVSDSGGAVILGAPITPRRSAAANTMDSERARGGGGMSLAEEALYEAGMGVAAAEEQSLL